VFLRYEASIPFSNARNLPKTSKDFYEFIFLIDSMVEGESMLIRFLLGQRQSLLIRGPGLSCPAKSALLQKSAKPTNDSSPPIHRWDRET
jgi:hypothetical protein